MIYLEYDGYPSCLGEFNLLQNTDPVCEIKHLKVYIFKEGLIYLKFVLSNFVFLNYKGHLTKPI